MTEAMDTKIIKGSGRTIFLDLRRAKNDSLYVTVSVLGRNQSGEAERQLITLFGDQAAEVAVSLAELVKGKKMVIDQPKEKEPKVKQHA